MASASAAEALSPADSPHVPLGARARVPSNLSALELEYCREGRVLVEQMAQWMPSAQQDVQQARRLLMPGLNAQLQRVNGMELAVRFDLAERLRGLGTARAESLADRVLAILPVTQPSPGSAASEPAPVQPPRVDRDALRRLHERAVASKDPVLLLAAAWLPCEPPARCASLKDWHRLEPDNARAWMFSGLRGDALLDRLLAAPRSDSHWDAVRELLNRASPPSIQGPAALHREVALIGLESAWPGSVTNWTGGHCRAAAVGSATHARCTLLAERLWAWSETSHDLAQAGMLAKQMGLQHQAPWPDRLREAAALEALERAWAERIAFDKVAPGCQPPGPDDEVIAMVRREGRLTLMRRLLRETQAR